MELIGCLISRISMTFNCNVSHLIKEAMIPCQALSSLQIVVVRCIHILGFVYLTNTYVIHVISAQSSLFNPSSRKLSCIKCIALSKPPTYTNLNPHTPLFLCQLIPSLQFCILLLGSPCHHCESWNQVWISIIFTIN